MAKKQNDQPSIAENSIVDGAPLTAQERARRAKDEKRAEKEKKRQLRQEMYAEARSRLNGSSRAMSIALIALIGVIVLGCALLLTLQLGGGWRAKEGMTYFLDNAELPEIEDDGVTACVNEAYYTANGGMYVRLTLGNGKPTTQHPTKIAITLYNAADEIIAQAVTTSVPEKYFVVAGGQKDYPLRITKNCVKIPDDPLSEIRYEITVSSEHYESTEGD